MFINNKLFIEILLILREFILTLHAACFSVYLKQLGGVGGGGCTPPPGNSTSIYGMKLKLTPGIPLDKRS